MPNNANGRSGLAPDRTVADISFRRRGPHYNSESSSSKGDTASVRYQRLVRHLHGLGPRVVGEVLFDLAGDDPRLLERLKYFSAWNADDIAELGARDWAQMPIRLIASGNT